MYAITGFEATGKDKLFSFTNTGTAVDLTDFSTGTQADGGATLRQAVWIGNCTGDGSSVYLVAQGGSLGTPALSPGNALAKIGDGDDRIIHVRKGARLWAATDSVGTAKVRVVEVA
jgi:hypothetical protein